jgi:hypothetical protein
MPTASRTRHLAGLLALCTAVFAAAPARGQDQAAIEKIAKINKKAVDAYQDLNFDEAKKLLQNAIEAAGESRLENHPVNARTYVHMGVVLLAGFKQKDDAIKAFRKALQIQADIKLDKSLATPEIQEVYDEAVAAQKAEPPPPPAEAVKHQPLVRSNRGVSITIKAGAEGAKSVTLYFRADGAEEFGEKEMREDPPGSGVWLGEIPGSAAQGAALQYYIEASGADDAKLGSKGTAEDPLTIALQGGKKEPKPAPEPEGSTWFVGLAVGSGLGWTVGYGEVNSKDKVSPTGFAPSTLAHVAPEVGYFLSPTLMLSLQLRLQLVTGGSTYHSPVPTDCGGDGICSPAWHAEAALARATYFLSEGDFRPYVVGMAGGGQIRHVAKFESVPECGDSKMEPCVDTVAAGPVLVGGGGGFLYDLTPGFALTLGTNLILGFTTFTFHVDLNAGVAMSF